MLRRIPCLCLYSAVSLFLFIASRGHAQTTFGSITGVIADSSGATVPDARVELSNLNTAERRSMGTSPEGLYRFVNLSPGRYRLEVQKTGFKRIARDAIDLEVQSTLKIDLSLEVGSATETVEVTEQTPLLQAETSSLGQVIDQRKVNDLPLNGRNPLNLVALVPSVVPQGQTMQTPTGTNVYAWGNYQIGGGMANQSAAFLDGAPLNIGYGNIVSFVPTQDSIQEFKVQTNNLSAEFGRFAGGVINLNTKSGSNQIRGGAWEFLRNKSLNSNNFFNNRAGVKTPAFTQNQFGFDLGGPVHLPRLYNGENKTFFFFSYEGFQLRQGQSFTTTVPTLAQRKGDFSNTRDASGNVIPIYDPLTTAADPARPGFYTRSPYTGNIIPASQFDPTATKMLPLSFPLPNAIGNPLTGTNNWVANASVGGQNSEVVSRIDQKISDKQHLFGRFSYWGNTNLPIDPFQNGVCPDRCSETYHNRNVVLDDVYTLTPTTILDIRASYLRFVFDRTPVNLGFDLTKIGWPASLNDQVAFRVLPVPTITGYDPLSFFSLGGAGSVIFARSDSLRIAGSLTKLLGPHTLKGGAEFLRLAHNFALVNTASGTFSFNQNFTASDPLHPAGGSGLASFLLGYPASGSATEPYVPSGSLHYPALFFQDDWKLTKRLTLNLGVRWGVEGPWTERYNRLTYFDRNAPDPIGKQAGLSYKGLVGLVGSSTRSARSNVNSYNGEFAPRLGLAYQVTPKTVLRAGYGIFWLPNDVVQGNFPGFDPINSISTPFTSSIDGGLTPVGHLSNPFPLGILQPPGRDPKYQQILYGQGLSEMAPDNPFGYAQQWNLNIQRELFQGILIDAAYAGSKGTHLPFGSQQINQLSDQYLALGSQLLQQVSNPLFGLVQQGSLAAKTVPYGQLLRPFPEYLNVAIPGSNQASSTYHSFQLKGEKRFSGGASILLAYTFAKLISDTDSLESWLEGGGTAGIQNWNNLRGERSLASFHVPHRLVVSYVLDLPFGKGRHFLANIPSVADHLIGGWGLQGITTIQNGFPLHLNTAQNLTNSLGGGSRPNVVGDSAASGSRQSRLNQWFNTAAFAQPAAFTFGNESRNDPSLRGDGMANS